MYKEIEKEYTQLNPDNDFNKYYKKMSLVVGSIFYFLFQLTDYKILLFILFIILLLLLSMRFFENDIKKFLSEDEQKSDLIRKLKTYFTHIDNIKRENLIDILKKQNVNNEKKLELAINYYNKKSPIKIESGILGWILSSAITLATLVAIGFNEKTGEMDYNKLGTILSSTIGILIVVLVPIISVKFTVKAIKPSRFELYNELEDGLTHIYINFESYKYKLMASDKKTNKNNLKVKL